MCAAVGVGAFVEVLGFAEFRVVLEGLILEEFESTESPAAVHITFGCGGFLKESFGVCFRAFDFAKSSEGGDAHAWVTVFARLDELSFRASSVFT